MPRKGENVYHRKDGLWEARYTKGIDKNGKKIKGSVYARTCREAKEKRQIMIDSIRYDMYKPITRCSTLSQIIEEWLSINKNRLKLSSYQKYCGLFKNHIENTIGSRPLIYFTTPIISEYSSDRLNSGLSPTTVNSILVFLHSCFKYAHRQYGFSIPDIVYLASNHKEMRVLSKEEQQKFVKYLVTDIDIYKFGILLALYTGLRIGELCALEWNDIDEDRINVRRTVQRLRNTQGTGTELHIGLPKTASSLREIPIPSFLKDIIGQFRSKSNGNTYVFALGTSKLIEPRLMQLHFKKHLAKAGLSDVNFHALRHTFATRCVECEFEIKSLSGVLGHAKVQTTLAKYVHSSFELKAENMEKLKKINYFNE